MTPQPQMEAAFEALLFVANEPVRRADFLEMFPDEERAVSEAALETVLSRYREADDRGVMVDEIGGGVRLVTRPELHDYLVGYFASSKPSRISMAALETLAIVAYRQPITAPEIQELRQVGSSSVLRTLLENRLVRIAGRKEVVGRPFLYRTTREFLLRFGLNHLRDLPPLEEFEEMLAAELSEEENDGLPSQPSPDAEEEVMREVARLDEIDRESYAASAADEGGGNEPGSEES